MKARMQQLRLLPIAVFLAQGLMGMNQCTGTSDPEEDWDREVRAHDIQWDVSSMTGTDAIEIQTYAEAGGLSLSAQGITITRVTDDSGTVLDFIQHDGQVDVGIPGASDLIHFAFDFEKVPSLSFSGYSTTNTGAFTWTWYDYAGNLYPARLHPREGATYQLTVTGVPEGQIAVYPQEISALAPSYQPAFTIGAFQNRLLGKTDSGAEVSVYWLPGFEADALSGSEDLVSYLNFYITTFGPYIFGNKAGSVLVDWNAAAGIENGGKEHHPLWHIEQQSGANPLYHAHEAAHGWAGDGLRLAYAEDFCLISEGLATALSVWAMGAADGTEAEAYYWNLYEEWAAYSAAEETSVLAWPEGQDTHDMYEELWGLKPYAYGALYYRLLRDEIIRVNVADQLFSVLKNFYTDRLGTAVSSDELLLFIENQTGYPAYDLAVDMVRNEGIADYYGLNTNKTEPPTLAVPGSTRAVERLSGF